MFCIWTYFHILKTDTNIIHIRWAKWFSNSKLDIFFTYVLYIICLILYVLYIEIWQSEKTRSKALAKKLASFSFIKIDTNIQHFRWSKWFLNSKLDIFLTHVPYIYTCIILHVLCIEIWQSKKTSSKALSKKLASFSLYYTWTVFLRFKDGVV